MERLLALYSSLRQHSGDFHLWVCCMDEDVYTTLEKLKLENTTLLDLDSIEEEELLKWHRSNKTIRELCSAIKAPLLLYILKNNINIDKLVYVDADMYFFADARLLFDEIKQGSVFLSPARSRKVLEAKYGKYQAGLIGLRRDNNTLEFLRWLRQRCLEWCYECLSDGKYLEQRYLDSVNAYIPDIRVLQHRGINAGPWNIRDSRVYKGDDSFYCNGDKLIVYHFSGDVKNNIRQIMYNNRAVDEIYRKYNEVMQDFQKI